MFRSIVLTFVLFSLLQCSGGSDANSTETAEPIPGTYMAELPAASSPGRLIWLMLEDGGKARMESDYQNMQPEIVEVGNWSETEAGNVQVDLKRVGGVGESKLSFEREGEKLVLVNNTDYGSEGLALMKTEEKPAMEKELLMWVGPEKKPCSTGEMPTECLQVQYGERMMADQWVNFYSPIKGLEWEAGKTYQLKVKRITNPNPPMDAGRYSYELLEKVSES